MIEKSRIDEEGLSYRIVSLIEAVSLILIKYNDAMCSCDVIETQKIVDSIIDELDRDGVENE